MALYTSRHLWKKHVFRVYAVYGVFSVPVYAMHAFKGANTVTPNFGTPTYAHAKQPNFFTVIKLDESEDFTEPFGL